jgi:hypothetical protein
MNVSGVQRRYCALIASLAKAPLPTAAQSDCGGCSGKDDGTNCVSVQVLALLQARMNKGSANDYTVGQLVTRAGAPAAGTALVSAIRAGFPQAQAEALATAHGIQLD